MCIQARVTRELFLAAFLENGVTFQCFPYIMYRLEAETKVSSLVRMLKRFL